MVLLFMFLNHRVLSSHFLTRTLWEVGNDQPCYLTKPQFEEKLAELVHKRTLKSPILKSCLKFILSLIPQTFYLMPACGKTRFHAALQLALQQDSSLKTLLCTRLLCNCYWAIPQELKYLLFFIETKNPSLRENVRKLFWGRAPILPRQELFHKMLKTRMGYVIVSGVSSTV